MNWISSNQLLKLESYKNNCIKDRWDEKAANLPKSYIVEAYLLSERADNKNVSFCLFRFSYRRILAAFSMWKRSLYSFMPLKLFDR